jgi:protein-L-isoaspartate(D-aspartate) O-methyltransferase
MVREIAAAMRQTPTLMGQRPLDPRVMRALDTVPRHAFVPPHLQQQAYANRPLAIGYGQTISQPYIVAVMTNLLQLDKDEVVLEIGTGSGYQAAVLATLARQVYSIEIIKELAEPAQERLQRLGYTNVEVRVSDGYAGWEAHAPFDAIMVTAAASHIPPPLLQQLKPSGRMLIPVGSPFQTQQLLLVTKDAAGQVTTRSVLPVAFVPLTGQH